MLVFLVGSSLFIIGTMIIIAIIILNQSLHYLGIWPVDWWLDADVGGAVYAAVLRSKITVLYMCAT